MANEARDCYGKMFPSVTERFDNVMITGKVFGYYVEHPGLMATSRSAFADEKAWRQCVECKDYESCYRLSISKLLLEAALTA